ncbi:MAG: HTH-type transcriptional regulator SinR [Candidatus Daviesbacteria bacterium GW2011_GWA2_39_33]|nr:MAG: HTH-type transcriptional regulator SinR [Candidatus Daviesbacteria bacterium GW2011_GWA2_39_33]
MNSSKQDIYKLFKEAREKKGFTQADVAKKAGLKSTNYYAVIERGEVNTSYENIEKIAEVLGIKLLS